MLKMVSAVQPDPGSGTQPVRCRSVRFTNTEVTRFVGTLAGTNIDRFSTQLLSRTDGMMIPPPYSFWPVWRGMR